MIDKMVLAWEQRQRSRQGPLTMQGCESAYMTQPSDLPSHFLALLQLCDTALPIGAYAFSNGLETYTQQGLIPDVLALQEWLKTVLHHVVHSSHLLPLALAYRATAGANWIQLEHLDQHLTAMKHPRELREASVKTGQGLLRLAVQVWPGLAVERLHALCQQHRVSGHQALVLGVIGCQLGYEERIIIEAGGYQWLSSVISAALRLLPIGQLAGQQLLAALLPHLPVIADDIQQQSWDDLSSAAPDFDIRAMQHETLYTRLFQS
jgi:urease accessory protein